MDESIKCECGNDKFWWFGARLRCPTCHNEYRRIGFEGYLFRRFNKEDNYYPERWDIFSPFSIKPGISEKVDQKQREMIDDMEKQAESFQQISDKGLEFLSKDKSIIENAVILNDQFSTDEITEEEFLKRCEENWSIHRESLKEAIKSMPMLNPYLIGQWRSFWDDRAKFEYIIKNRYKTRPGYGGTYRK